MSDDFIRTSRTLPLKTAAVGVGRLKTLRRESKMFVFEKKKKKKKENSTHSLSKKQQWNRSHQGYTPMHTHTFCRQWTCCFCRSSRAWHWVSRDSLSSSILPTLSFSRLRSLSRSLMAASWVIWVACRLLIWPMNHEPRHVRGTRPVPRGHQLLLKFQPFCSKNKRKFDWQLTVSYRGSSFYFVFNSHNNFLNVNPISRTTFAGEQQLRNQVIVKTWTTPVAFFRLIKVKMKTSGDDWGSKNS